MPAGDNTAVLQNAAWEKLVEEFGVDDLNKIADRQMFFVPEGLMCCKAYAITNSGISVYGDWYDTDVYMHEVGHNMGMSHSTENGEEYGDESCIMGGGSPPTCFNGAKSWQMGWYNSRSYDYNIENGIWKGRLIGQVDYSNPNDITSKVVLKLSPGSISSPDYFVMFNRIKAGTKESQNLVMVVRSHQWANSELVAKLGAGQSTSLNYFHLWDSLEVTVNEINLNANPAYADVTVQRKQFTGTCGGGNIGNGICANAGECCSIFGWCGVTDEHCGGSSTCLDTPDWVDTSGDGCDWYETHDDPGCPTYGYFGGNLGSANDNCCHCKETGSPTSYPTTAASLTNIPTNFPTLGSSEFPTLPPRTSNYPTNLPSLRTDAPTTESPTTEAPTTEAPTKAPTMKPTTMKPTPQPTLKPTSAKPTTLKPITMKPTPQPTLKPTSAKPTTLKPTTMKPTHQPTSKPTSAKPTTLKPTTMKPTQQPTPKPTSAKPTSKPTTMKPTTKKPTLKPTTKQPTNAPTEVPTSEAPTSEAPTSEAPTSEAPTSEAPTSQAPTTKPPTTKPPTKKPTKKPTNKPTSK